MSDRCDECGRSEPESVVGPWRLTAKIFGKWPIDVLFFPGADYCREEYVCDPTTDEEGMRRRTNMFKLIVDDVDIIVLRRVLLTYATNLETAQSKCDAEGQAAPVMDERAYRFIQYAQQLGAHATGRPHGEQVTS